MQNRARKAPAAVHGRGAAARTGAAMHVVNMNQGT